MYTLGTVFLLNNWQKHRLSCIRLKRIQYFVSFHRICVNYHLEYNCTRYCLKMSQLTRGFFFRSFKNHRNKTSTPISAIVWRPFYLFSFLFFSKVENVNPYTISCATLAQKGNSNSTFLYPAFEPAARHSSMITRTVSVSIRYLAGGDGGSFPCV